MYLQVKTVPYIQNKNAKLDTAHEKKNGARVMSKSFFGNLVQILKWVILDKIKIFGFAGNLCSYTNAHFPGFNIDGLSIGKVINVRLLEVFMDYLSKFCCATQHGTITVHAAVFGTALKLMAVIVP